ncbi:MULTISPECIES: TonB-dependent receptor [Brevundimonas]|jgi:iron complex outermembrane receptor protein|uniref:TonB-dependent receptor n=1 Tax=Brevundimonas TaxID=41275 RepID=UPI0006CFB9AE|nr:MULTISPECIES: TonB-dependent receptor [unclassified Brevundimonas]ALJ07345.1 TonB-dependent receptor [Brevundimonas sp. DS20]MAL56998.1 TonB-dependent receptor [Brevundimonas sp.]MBD3838067.1 TonB-dependent receptor [Brevundimonas sp.]QFU30483.1 Pesticin receptor precursor [Brevundimonas sp. Bb-A]HAF82046.1 TonB-dependent receptor [Brevundimonas sp.]
MNRHVKCALLAGAAWGVLAGATVAQDAEATAQAANAQDAATVDDIVVTARRRAESLQDVPVAVTAVTGEQLEARGALDITELARSTPSLTLNAARGSNSTLISFIRGVGQQDPLWGFDPGVGLYIDDVYVARPQAAVLDIFDVERVEVLRGPQGTLYGRNTIGGAIKYVTSRINADEPEGRLRASYGSYNQRDVIASAQLPFSDEFKVSAALARYLRDGYGKNLNTGNEHYNKDVTAFRASAEWSPTDSLFFRLAGDLVNDDSNARHGHREFAPSPADVYDTNAGAGDKNRVQTRGVSLTGEWEMSDMFTFKSITAYREGLTRGNIDFDNLPQPILDIPAAYDDDQFSQEFQVLVSAGRLNGVAGVYYMDANASGAFDTVVGLANLTTLTSGSVATKSYAVFADFSYDVTDALSVSVGGRFTKDEKEGTVFRQRYLGIRSPYFGNTTAVPFLGEAPRTNYTRTREFEKFTPRIAVNYKFGPDLTAYASWGEGFKSGGFDMRGDAVLYPATVNGYAPETVETYEIGLKGSLLDRRLTFATAIFDSSYENQQITTQYPAGATIASVVDNVGSSSIRGWEFEGRLRATDALTFNASLSYIDAKFDEFLAYIPTGPLNTTCPTVVGCFVDVSSQRDFQNTPEWTGSISANYNWVMENGSSIAFIPSIAYRGAYQQFETPAPLLDQDAYWMYDASIVWTSSDDRLTFGVHGKNLGDERYRVGGYTFPGALTGDSIIGFYGPPRTVTATLGLKF